MGNIIGSTKGFNSTQIKILAMALMFCDHVHQMYASLGAPIWLTWIGRPVFPLFLFCAAIAFEYTRNRGKYLLRLFIASCCMVVITTSVQAILPSPSGNGLMNNAFATFLVAGLYMLFADIITNGVKEKNLKKILGGIGLCFLPILSALPLAMFFAGFTGTSLERALLVPLMMIPSVINVEGSFLMVIVGVAFYVLRKWRVAQIIALVAISVIEFIINNDGANQWLMFLALIPILLYNGEKGKGHKWLFYIFYPAHIVALYVAATLMGG